MNAKIEEIYRDVLINGCNIAILKQDGNRYHVVTYYPSLFLVRFMKDHFEYDLELMLRTTPYKDYMLQDD